VTVNLVTLTPSITALCTHTCPDRSGTSKSGDHRTNSDWTQTSTHNVSLRDVGRTPTNWSVGRASAVPVPKTGATTGPGGCDRERPLPAMAWVTVLA